LCSRRLRFDFFPIFSNLASPLTEILCASCYIWKEQGSPTVPLDKIEPDWVRFFGCGERRRSGNKLLEMNKKQIQVQRKKGEEMGSFGIFRLLHPIPSAWRPPARWRAPNSCRPGKERLTAWPITYRAIDGLAIYQGHIILGPAGEPPDGRSEASFTTGGLWPGGRNDRCRVAWMIECPA
jgi:hypothetical protein